MIGNPFGPRLSPMSPERSVTHVSGTYTVENGAIDGT